MAAARQWGPGLIGMTIALSLYGASVGQYVFYLKSFPRDTAQLKFVACSVFLFESTQSLAMIWAFRHYLIDCRSNSSPECTIRVPISVILTVCIIYWITFIVQCFYAHRVWIISNRNRIVTSAVLVFAFAQWALGLSTSASIIRTPTYQALATTPFLPLAAAASALCDSIITISIYHYLRPGRTGVNRQDGSIKKLNFVFIQMGLLSLINALAVVIAYFTQNHGQAQLVIAAPGTILSKTYANSMYSVLNARKLIRDEQQARALRTIRMPTLPTIQTHSAARCSL